MKIRLRSMLRARLAAPIAVVFAVSGATGGVALAVKNSSASNSAPKESPFQAGDARITHAVPIPTGFVVLGMADGKDESGVWLWGSTDSEAQVLRQRGASSQVSTWSLGNPVEIRIQAGSESGFSIDPDGNVWIGAEMTLVKLEPISGSVKRWDIPTVALNNQADAIRPPSAKGAQHVRALAAEAGKVVIAVAGASELVTFDPGRQVFERASLPKFGDANDVAILSDGTIAVGMRNYDTGKPDTVLIRQPGKEDILVPTESWFVEAAGDHFLAGLNGLASITKQGGRTPISQAGNQLNPNTRAKLLKDGRIAVTTSDGILVLDERTRRQEKLPFPSGDCSPQLAGRQARPDGVTPSGPSGQRCFSSARFLATDSAGNLYFAGTAGSGNVERVDGTTF